MNIQSGASLQPQSIHVDQQNGTFEIAWEDVSGKVALADMRKLCPCALCDDLREQQAQMSGLHMISESEMPSVVLKDVIPVGNYAVQLRWQDGHDTGIFPYSFLKELIGSHSD